MHTHTSLTLVSRSWEEKGYSQKAEGETFRGKCGFSYVLTIGIVQVVLGYRDFFYTFVMGTVPYLGFTMVELNLKLNLNFKCYHKPEALQTCHFHRSGWKLRKSAKASASKVAPAKKLKSKRTKGHRGQLRINPKHRRLARVKGQPRRVKNAKAFQKPAEGDEVKTTGKWGKSAGKRQEARGQQQSDCTPFIHFVCF